MVVGHGGDRQQWDGEVGVAAGGLVPRVGGEEGGGKGGPGGEGGGGEGGGG